LEIETKHLIPVGNRLHLPFLSNPHSMLEDIHAGQSLTPYSARPRRFLPLAFVDHDDWAKVYQFDSHLPYRIRKPRLRGEVEATLRGEQR